MASSYSSNLKIELMATGENSGTWGTVTNTNLGTAMEQAVIGYGNPDYTSDANLTISITNSNASQAARCLVLNVTSVFGALTATRELIVPTSQKQYIVQNNTTGGQSITVKTSAGTGITVTNGRKAHLYVDGTNVIQMFDFVDINGGAIDGTPIGASSASTGAFTTLGATGNVTLGDADTDTITQAASYVTGTQLKSAKTATNTLALAAYDVDGATYTNLITLTAANEPTLALTSTGVGTINKMSIGATTASTGAFTTLSANSTVTFSGGTANGVAYLNGSNVLTTGSVLVFDGTNLGVGLASPGCKVDVLAASNTSLSPTVRVYSNNLAVNTAISYDGIQGSGDFYIGSTSNSPVIFKQSNTEQMRLTSTSLYTASTINVGIGTSSPSSKLEIVGVNPKLTINANDIVNGRTATLSLISGTSADPVSLCQIMYGASNSTTAGTLTFVEGDGTTERMRLDISGKLGIGNTTPSNYQASANQLVVGLTGSNGITVVSGTAEKGNLFFSDGTSGTEGYRGFLQYDHSLDCMNLGTNALTAATIDTSGNVGIGNTLPNSRLDVRGDTGSSVSAIMRIRGTNATSRTTRLQFEDYSGALADGTIDFKIPTSGSAASAILQMGLNGSAALAIDINNNVLVGTTNAQLQLDATTNNGNISVISSAANANLNLASKGAGSINFNATGGFYCTQIYSTAVGGTNRAVYSDNTGTIGYLSSVRASKINIENITNASWLMQLNPVKFNYRKKDEDGNYTEEFDNTIEYGLIAEEAEIIKQELCFYDEVDGTQVLRGVNYQKLVVPMLKAIQEQQALITQLTARITALEGA